MFDLVPTPIAGCYEIQPKVLSDDRGCFVKTFHRAEFAHRGLQLDFDEEYYSVSHAGVIRGLHFQLPPMDHEKVVYCVSGAVFDAVVDLRVGSRTYGQGFSTTLSASKGNGLYIPKGLAHGFAVTSESAILTYKVATAYSPQHDAGILWNSAGIAWPITDPILSSRDQSFVSLSNFQSPFHFQSHE